MIVRELSAVALLAFGLWVLWGLGTVWGVLPVEPACTWPWAAGKSRETARRRWHRSA